MAARRSLDRTRTAELLRKAQNGTESHPSYQAAAQKECEFRVGRSLHFAVVGIGKDDVAVTIYKADIDGDFYLTVGTLHGCAIVKPTKDAPAALRGDYAFVSPRDRCCV